MKVEGLDPTLVRPRDWYRQRPEWGMKSGSRPVFLMLAVYGYDPAKGLMSRRVAE
jgi:hypothetical protein